MYTYHATECINCIKARCTHQIFSPNVTYQSSLICETVEKESTNTTLSYVIQRKHCDINIKHQGGVLFLYTQNVRTLKF